MSDDFLDAAMADRQIKVWYDAEGDYLEVIFDQKPGYFRQMSHDQVMAKIDDQGKVLGFSVLAVRTLKKKPLEMTF